MEDLGEGIRFATGRQRARLQRQRERTVISESSRREGALEDKDYWERLKELRDEDQEDAKKAREQRRKWTEEDMLRAKSQHEEMAGLQNARFEATRDHLVEQKALEDERIEIQREIWKEQKEAEAERARLQQEVIEAQKRSIQELSTPVIPIMDRIIVMPLVGSIDSMRARDITRSLLAGISQHRAKVVILDVTGVSIMDTGIVNHLNKTIQAA